MSDIFAVAPINEQRHVELCERLQQTRERQTPDNMIQLEAAGIIADCQAPLLFIIEQLQCGFEAIGTFGLINNGTSIDGLPTDLRGSAGGQGGRGDR